MTGRGCHVLRLYSPSPSPTLLHHHTIVTCCRPSGATTCLKSSLDPFAIHTPETHMLLHAHSPINCTHTVIKEIPKAYTGDSVISC